MSTNGPIIKSPLEDKIYEEFDCFPSSALLGGLANSCERHALYLAISHPITVPTRTHTIINHPVAEPPSEMLPHHPDHRGGRGLFA